MIKHLAKKVLAKVHLPSGSHKKNFLYFSEVSYTYIIHIKHTHIYTHTNIDKKSTDKQSWMHLTGHSVFVIHFLEDMIV